MLHCMLTLDGDHGLRQPTQPQIPSVASSLEDDFIQLIVEKNVKQILEQSKRAIAGSYVVSCAETCSGSLSRVRLQFTSL
jgi:hypothetical protein